MAIVLGAAVIGRVDAADWYVSPSGDDANPGTAAYPFRTINHARDVLRGKIPGMTENFQVLLAGGWHVLGAPLVFTQADGGANGHVVTYANAPGAVPVISGGQFISGWTLHDAVRNIWQAVAPGAVLTSGTRQLFVDDVRAPRAHGGDPIVGATETATGYTLPGTNALATWAHPEDAEFIYNAAQGGVTGFGTWVEPRVPVASATATGGTTVITMATPAFTLARATPQIAVGLPTAVESAYELLDAPGQWYFDRHAGMFYAIPQANQDLNRVRVVAPVLENLITAAGVAGAPLANLRFSGITFAHTTWMRPSGVNGFPEIQANHCQDGSRPQAAVVIAQASGITFTGCVFAHLGGAGLQYFPAVRASSVSGCRFTDMSGSGMVLGDVDDPTVTDPTQQDNGDIYSDWVFTANACEYHGGVPLYCGFLANAVVAHNEIMDAPYSGISMGWGWGRTSYASGNLISSNRVTGFLEQLSDGGAIYVNGPQPGCEMTGNYCSGALLTQFGGAIYPDEGSTGWNIHGNVSAGSGNWLYVWTSSIHDLAVHDNWSQSGVFIDNGTNDVLTNNTVFSATISAPAAAQVVMSEAGLEPAYIGTRSLPDGAAAAPTDPAAVIPAAPTVVVVGNGTAQPVLTGTTIPGATVTVVVAGAAVGTVTADANGNWVWGSTATAAQTVTVTVADFVGTSAGSGPVAVNTSAAAAGGSGGGSGGCGAGAGLGVMFGVLAWCGLRRRSRC